MPYPDMLTMISGMSKVGEDIRESLLAPVQGKLKALQLQREMQIEGKKLSREEELEAAKKRAGALITKRYGAEAGALYEAGESLSSIAALRKVGKGDGGGGNVGKFAKKFSLANAYIRQAQGILEGAMKKIVDAQEAGDDEAYQKAQDNYNILYDAVNEKLKGEVASLDKALQTEVSVDVFKEAEKALLQMHPDNVDVLLTVIKKKRGKMTGLSEEILTDIDNTTEVSGVKVDFGDVPSNYDVSVFVADAYARGLISMEQIKGIMGSDDPDVLAKIANNKDYSPHACKLAGMKAIQMSVSDQLDPNIRRNVKTRRKEEAIVPGKFNPYTGEPMTTTEASSRFEEAQRHIEEAKATISEESGREALWSKLKVKGAKGKKKTAEKTVAEYSKSFDAESEDYDYSTAKKAGIKPDKTGHWPSIDPRTGMILKGKNHPTWDLTVKEEKKLGHKIIKKGKRYYIISSK